MTWISEVWGEGDQAENAEEAFYTESEGGGLVGGLVHTGDRDMRDQKETSQK